MVTKTATVTLDAAQFPELTVAQNRLLRVKRDRDANDREIKALTGQLRSAANPGRHALHEAAMKLLDGEELESSDNAVNTRKELNERFQRNTILEHAVALANRQVDEARAKASRELAKKLEPQYRDILANLKASLLTLRQAAIVEDKFRAQVRDSEFDSVFSYLRPMPFTGCGWIEDGQSVGRIDQWLAELDEYYGK